MRVTVCRVWKEGEVTAFCDDEIVGAQMELNSFLAVLMFESGIEDELIYNKLMDAAPKVLSKMKKETTKVVS